MLYFSHSLTLVATVAPANATNKSVTWSSSAPAVATVADGVVTPLTAGTATITVTTVDGGFTAICAVTVNPAAVAVGDSYGGGIVAYILQVGDPGYDESVQHGLIAATSDQGSAVWSYSWTNLGTETGIGTGQSNTTAIVLWSNIIGETGVAAQRCDNYSITVDDVTYSDWFLPSIDELNKLYINRVAIGGFPGRQYWSSSEQSAMCAWLWGFYLGVKLYTIKNVITYSVRAVRAF